MQAHPRKAGAGFTLLELMIVVVIIAILAAIAIPNYLQYSLRSRRSDALAGLAQNQAILERCYAAGFDYTQVNVATPPAGCTALHGPSPGGYYTIAFPSLPTTTSYVITATPVAGSPQLKDTACTSFTVNSTNQQTSTGSGGSTVCWSH